MDPAVERFATGSMLTALEVAVPLWIIQLAGTTAGERQVLAERDAAAIARHADVWAGRVSLSPEAFLAVARGLAVAAYQPGGVRFAGRRWSAREPADQEDETAIVIGAA